MIDLTSTFTDELVEAMIRHWSTVSPTTWKQANTPWPTGVQSLPISQKRDSLSLLEHGWSRIFEKLRATAVYKGTP